jgi:general secretion pathway protein G
VELLVVVAILGVLVTSFVLLINPQKQFQRAHDSKRKGDLKQIQAALELYRSDQGSYPSDTGNTVANCGGNSLIAPPCASSNATYIQNVPRDPSGPNYYYVLRGDGTYALFACAESVEAADSNSDPVVVQNNAGAQSRFSDCPRRGGNTYFYRVESP